MQESCFHLFHDYECSYNSWGSAILFRCCRNPLPKISECTASLATSKSPWPLTRATPFLICQTRDRKIHFHLNGFNKHHHTYNVQCKHSIVLSYSNIVYLLLLDSTFYVNAPRLFHRITTTSGVSYYKGSFFFIVHFILYTDIVFIISWCRLFTETLATAHHPENWLGHERVPHKNNFGHKYKQHSIAKSLQGITNSLHSVDSMCYQQRHCTWVTTMSTYLQWHENWVKDVATFISDA